MKLKIKKDFPYFHGGHRRVDYVKGEEIESDDEEFIAVATTEKWSEEAVEKKGKGAAPENKAKDAAPENKAKDAPADNKAKDDK